MNKITDRTIEVATHALYEVKMYLDGDELCLDEHGQLTNEYFDRCSAWHKLKNFIDLVDKERKGE